MELRQPAPVEQHPLCLAEREAPEPGPGELQVRVEVCGVCRTDLHLVEGDLEPRRAVIVPGHEVVGRVSARGEGAERFEEGARVGIAWLHRSCSVCRFCRAGRENLCLRPTFTGWEADGDRKSVV
jgi:propanol-preferring alcohol dehydrogenase